MITSVLIAGISAFCVGIVVLWANPARFTNQAFASLALIVTAYSVLIYTAHWAGQVFLENHSTSLR